MKTSANVPASTSLYTTVDAKLIEVEVQKKSVKRMNLHVRADGSVSLSIPRRTSLTAAQHFLDEQQAWLERALKRTHERRQRKLPSAVVGKAIFIFGKPVMIRAVMNGHSDRKRAVCQYKSHELLVEIPSELESNTPSLVSSAVDAYLKELLLQRVDEILSRWEQIVGRRCSKIGVRHMTTRWGSCNVQSAAITLNSELAERDPRCLDMVLVHELCHLIVPNHGAAFYRQMQRCYPEWREAKKLLEQHPPRHKLAARSK